MDREKSILRKIWYSFQKRCSSRKSYEDNFWVREKNMISADEMLLVVKYGHDVTVNKRDYERSAKKNIQKVLSC